MNSRGRRSLILLLDIATFVSFSLIEEQSSPDIFEGCAKKTATFVS